MSLLPAPPESRTLGPGGKRISPLAWGMWRFEGSDVRAAMALIDAVFAAGITLFDTADIYGFKGKDGFGEAETLLGRVLAEAPGLRGTMVLATKGGIRPHTPYDQSSAYIASAIDASLHRLRTDHIDLWQIHRPDILAHPAETARALEDAVRSGKVGAVGVSNFTSAQIAALTHFVTIPLASIQPEFSPLAIAPVDDGLFDQAMAMGSAVLAWSPLGQGRIAHPTSKRELDVAEALDTVAKAQGVSRTAAAYSWIMAHPVGAIPIVGSQRAERITEAADALKVRWTRGEWYQVLVASRQAPLP